MTHQISLSDIVDNILLYAEDEDHYLHGKSAAIISKYAKRLLQEMNYAGLKTLNLLRCNVATATKSVSLPEDYVDYVRIFYVHDNLLYPVMLNNKLDINFNTDIDKDFEVSFGYNIVDAGEFSTTISDAVVLSDDFNPTGAATLRGYRYDHKHNRILFDFIPPYIQEVVIEYIADPLVGKNDASEIMVSKLYEKAIEAGVYYRMVENLRNVPMTEKIRAKKEWNIKYRDAVREQTAKANEILQFLKKVNYLNYKQ